MVHSFSENFIYGLKLQDIDIGVNSRIKFSDKTKSGLVTIEDFIVKSNDGLDDIEIPFFKKAEVVPIVKRKEIKSQVHIGNLAIDLTNPILQGTFNTFIVENTNLVKRSNIYRNLMQLNENCHFVYFSPVIDHIKRFAGIANENNKMDDCSVIELKKDNRAELYLFTKILPNYLNYLRESGKNVILILEDIEVLYMDLYNLFKNDPTDIVYSFLREIQTICCNTNQGSIGTVCFKGAVSAVDIQFQKMIDNLNTELMLLSSTVIDSADKNSKKGVKTAIAGFNFKPVKTKAFSPLQNYLSLRLYNLLLQVN